MRRKTDFSCCDLCENFEKCNDGTGRCSTAVRRKHGADAVPDVNVCEPASAVGMPCRQVCVPKERRRANGDDRDGDLYGREGQPTFELRKDVTKEWLTVFAL